MRLDHDELRLYANDMQRIYTEYRTKTRIETTEATGIRAHFRHVCTWIMTRSKGLNSFICERNAAFLY